MAIAEIISNVTQFSALLATIVGIIIVILAIRAASRFSPGEFRRISIASVIFVVIVVVGVSAMTLYHFTENYGYEELSEISESVWYILMFIALIVSCVEALMYARFGKAYMMIGKKKARK